MIEDRFVHQSPFEYEYEYRFTEYEYDEDRNAFMPERLNSRGCGRVTHHQETRDPQLACNFLFLGGQLKPPFTYIMGM